MSDKTFDCQLYQKLKDIVKNTPSDIDNENKDIEIENTSLSPQPLPQINCIPIELLQKNFLENLLDFENKLLCSLQKCGVKYQCKALIEYHISLCKTQYNESCTHYQKITQQMNKKIEEVNLSKQDYEKKMQEEFNEKLQQKIKEIKQRLQTQLQKSEKQVDNEKEKERKKVKDNPNLVINCKKKYEYLLKQKEKEIHCLKCKNEALQAEMQTRENALRDEINTLEKRYSETTEFFQRELDTCKENFRLLKNDWESEKRISALHIQELQKQIEEHSIEASKLHKEIEELNKTIDSLKQQHASKLQLLDSRHNAVIQEVEHKMTQICNKKKIEIEKLKRFYEKTISVYEMEKIKLNQMIHERDEQLNSLNSELS
ncbi:viral A-type inclusion protein [Reticulomyxa filosa]|uniref:Viral A-type inclusion protein n=1 Tax=Reticulomyxa filosa TaxID=46433 RepID=X6PC93_RETFI|nr:viral A-type inclusion protein [Reticulomyxa filosa]|eukprot:ETO35287.1 viral A-type inclusion protein [Reticulomyxa filosa]